MHHQWYTKKWITISLHTLFWVLFFVFPYLLRPDMGQDRPRNQQSFSNGIYYLHFLNNVIRIFLFYINAFVFIPHLLYKKKYGQYLLALGLSLTFMLLLDKVFYNLLMGTPSHKTWNFFVFNLLPFFFIIIASTAFRTIRDKIEENQRNQERETEHLKTELSFLRSQVSPHFMFNVLNNMVALARKKSDLLEPSLMKLSSLLRYMLYETDEDKVMVEKEVEYLNSYIDLQKQRFGKNIEILTSFDDIEQGHTIEPMLLIPFVENAFKHGTGLIADARIDLRLLLQNGKLSFTVSNRYDEALNEPKDKTSGIGLANVKRRLDLLYEKDHLLNIEKKDGWFTVSLHINLR